MDAFKVLYSEYEYDESVWDVLSVRVGSTDNEKQNINATYSWRYEHLLKDDTLIIESETDNSIPYEFWGVIENTFSADRWHLG